MSCRSALTAGLCETTRSVELAAREREVLGDPEFFRVNVKYALSVDSRQGEPEGGLGKAAQPRSPRSPFRGNVRSQYAGQTILDDRRTQGISSRLVPGKRRMGHRPIGTSGPGKFNILGLLRISSACSRNVFEPMEGCFSSCATL